MIYPCPVCGYGMDEPPFNFNICPCCGTEFDYHDAGRTDADLRQQWMLSGAKWWSPVDPKPDKWNASLQLIRAGHTLSLESHATSTTAYVFLTTVPKAA